MNTETRSIWVDSFNAPIAVFEDERQNYYPVSKESVKQELEDRFYIAIPSRHSTLRTPELTAKKDILMRMVYTGQISFDMAKDEQALIFFNMKPNI